MIFKGNFYIITLLLILSLISSGLFSCPIISSAAETKTITKTDTAEVTDLAYYDIWKHEDGTWQNGIHQGSSVFQRYTISEGDVPEGAAIVSISGEFNPGYNADPYQYYCVLSADVSGVDYEYDVGEEKESSTADLSYTVSTVLISRDGDNGQNIKEPWQAPNVEGWRYYIPAKFTITYTITEEIPVEPGDFELILDVPASARQGDEITITTSSVVDETDGMQYVSLERRFNSGEWELLETWDGNGTLGEDIGGSVNDTLDETGTYQYRTTGCDINDVIKTLTKSVTADDSQEITINAILNLPQFTYEGHTEIAADESTFNVDGIDYSAARAYAEGIARNSFKCNSSYVSISRLNDTKANVTFSKTGIYTVNLHVRDSNGKTGDDYAAIEVRKTPYILDNLSGFQKQNRKQILDITVATYPGKPLTDYTITLKDKKTGDLVRLTPDNPQENNTTVKTRAVTMTQDLERGFAYITVEFLTKTPSYAATGTGTRDFYYEISAEDSKGDTDTASKTFAVSPDLPPVPAISIDTAFLRNEGMNTASIRAEDVTVAADGDSVARTWYYGATTAPASFTDVSTMPGYKRLSFGTDKIVGFDRSGVGKFSVKLAVKEVWTEPTLEEYVTDADRLTGQATATSDVLNVAPIVGLELAEAIKKDVLLLANNATEYNTLLNNKTALKQALLADKIDGDIVIKKLLGSTPPDVTGVTTKLNLTFPAPKWGETGMPADEVGYYQMANDSERAYVETWAWVNNAPTTPVVVRAYNPYSGQVWSYTTTNSARFTFGQDDTGKYLYLIYSGTNQTVLLDKRTGATAGTVATALPNRVWLTDNYFLGVENGSLCCINQNTLQKRIIDAGVSAVTRVNGLFQYVTKTRSGVMLNTFDVNDFSIKRQLLVDTGNGKSSSLDYTAVAIGSDGNVVLFKTKGTGTDTFNGVRVYSASGSFVKEVAVSISEGIVGIFGPASEDGTIKHVVVHSEREEERSDFVGVNLVTGSVSANFRISTYYSYPDVDSFYYSGGTTYLYSAGFYLYIAGGYSGSGFAVAYNGSSISSTSVGKIDPYYDENFASSDRIFTSLFGDNSGGSSNGTKIRVSAVPKTLAQERAEAIAEFAGPDAYVGGVGTTAQQIKASTEVPKTAVKVKANAGAKLALNNLSLVPNKKYYYEYEIEPLTAGTKDQLTGITASTGTSTTAQSVIADTLYVTDSYEEDFSGGEINSFFTVNDAGRFYNGKYGAYYRGSSDYDAYMKLTFNVPSGKQAIVGLDSSLHFNNRNDHYDGTNVFIDGMRISEKVVYGNNPSSDHFEEHKAGRLFYKLIGAGTHTVECKVSAPYWTYVLIDNLRVDILSTSAPASSNSFYISDNNEWSTLSGTFNVPGKIISYGAQASNYFSGALPSEVTEIEEWWSGGNYYTAPKTIDYYQTVPLGHLQKGYLHFNTDYLTKKFYYYLFNTFPLERNTIEAGGTYDFKIYFEQGEGEYAHKVTIQDPKVDWARLYKAELITYPVNAITTTGNMAFNSNNTKYFFPKVKSNGKTNLIMSLPAGEYLLKNLRLYYIENGQKVYLENKPLANLSELASWTKSNVVLLNATLTEDEEDDEFIKIYKKGEKVLYNIFYDDYEEDPSKQQYWRYAHINWPPDAVHPDMGKTLNVSIDRFYLSGKYTVTHWQLDNTQRTGTVGDTSGYNKASNQVALNFYVDGGGSAPWVTYIKTNPAAVRENNTYTLAVGVDDSEKDTLTLETEVYLNGKSIFTHKRTNLQANAAGDYPETLISGLPQAKAGVYQVICTVSDYSGTGVRAYKFTVVSEGRITGFVNHTEQWDANRKKYNLKRFSEEVNRTMLLNDYIAMPAPRKRGVNVFWSGERFMLRAETEGEPSRVSVQIFSQDPPGGLQSTGYSTDLADTGERTGAGAELWEGILWDPAMINKWGRRDPEELVFRFTAYYTEGMTKTHTATVIMDSERDYWQLHRLW